MNVYLDDERIAPADWMQVNWLNEAIWLLYTGKVKQFSLDHNLGNDTKGTGYDVLLWIERAVFLMALYHQ